MSNRSSLSSRGSALIGKPLRADFEKFAQAEEDPFDLSNNPTGAMTLCIAENVLSWKEMQHKLEEIATRSIPTWVSKYTSILGAPVFRESLASFAERHITNIGSTKQQKLSSDHFAISSGATGIIELTALMLCDDGDVAAFPAPCYPVYKQDVGNKAKVDRYDIQPMSSWDSNPGQHPLSIQDLNRTLEELKQTDRTMKLLVLTQPDNPTGAIYSKRQLQEFADWSEKNEVHLCVNELYALSQVDHADSRLSNDYGEHPIAFHSFLNEVEKRKSPYLHWWYSFSKDFGISGLRTGVMYTRNEELLEAFGNYGAPSTVSNHTQWLLSELISDEAWISAFAKTQNDSTTDEEFWRKLFDDQKILLTATGGFGHQETGWLRIVYSCVEPAALNSALDRLTSFSMV